jgi:hypothetical protein
MWHNAYHYKWETRDCVQWLPTAGTNLVLLLAQELLHALAVVFASFPPVPAAAAPTLSAAGLLFPPHVQR